MKGAFCPGDVLRERYEVMRVIHDGPASVVYLAGDREAQGARCAVKQLRCSHLDSGEAAEALEQFARECDILKNLNHPGLPAFIDYCSDAEGPWLVMEYVEGESLQARLDAKGGPLSVDEVLSLTLQLLEILEYLHFQAPPVVFRDLKPANIMVTPSQQVRLIDFGIARHFSLWKVKDTYVMGTPGFSAPEQYGTRQTDPRSDIYALGATLFLLLTAQEPDRFGFRFPPLESLNADVSRWLGAMVAKCLSPEPMKRYVTVGKVRDAIARCTQTRHPGLLERLGLGRRR